MELFNSPKEFLKGSLEKFLKEIHEGIWRSPQQANLVKFLAEVTAGIHTVLEWKKAEIPE